MYLQNLSCCKPLNSPSGSLYIVHLPLLLWLLFTFACNMQKERAKINSFTSTESHTKFSLSLALFFINIGILILSFQTLHFYPYLYTYWKSYLIHLNVVIQPLFLYTLEYILTTSFQTLKFLYYPSTANIFPLNTGNLALFIHIGFLIWCFQTLEF